ncbi:MAG: 50S ribosomal protein L11 methyltransferase [Clostridiales bacterium]|nr:50S ribosomal protein L11 methyltransferase [Clostridiales bacterium]
MNYVELTIHTTHEAEELISSKLWEYTSYGVSVCDENDVIELITNRRNTWDYLEDRVTESIGSGVTLIKAYFDIEDADQKISSLIKELFIMRDNAKDFIKFGTLETVRRIVDGDDWIEIWRKHYKPMKIGDVIVCPEWIEYNALPTDVVVKIDSNMAFGTGEHETTSMCIEFLSKYIKPDLTVIDVGTGSGILGISAVLLGAKRSVMTDIDVVAVETAKHNAILNKVNNKCLITLDDLLSEQDAVGDIVVANITADILCVLANSIQKHVKFGTKLILSGILKEKAEMVINTYLPLGYKIINSANKGEWVALVLEKL